MIFIKYKGRGEKKKLFYDIITVIYNIIVLDNVCVKSFRLT